MRRGENWKLILDHSGVRTVTGAEPQHFTEDLEIDCSGLKSVAPAGGVLCCVQLIHGIAAPGVPMGHCPPVWSRGKGWGYVQMFLL